MKKNFIFYGCHDNGGHNNHAMEEETCGCGLASEDCGCSFEGDTCGCGSDGSSCGGGCSCGGDCSGHGQMVHISFEDGSEYDCPVLSIFNIEEQEYIALYHPEKQRALLYRFAEEETGIFLESIDDEEEFNAAANAFQNL